MDERLSQKTSESVNQDASAELKENVPSSRCSTNLIGKVRPIMCPTFAPAPAPMIPHQFWRFRLPDAPGVAGPVIVNPCQINPVRNPRTLTNAQQISYIPAAHATHNPAFVYLRPISLNPFTMMRHQSCVTPSNLTVTGGNVAKSPPRENPNTQKNIPIIPENISDSPKETKPPEIPHSMNPSLEMTVQKQRRLISQLVKIIVRERMGKSSSRSQASGQNLQESKICSRIQKLIASKWRQQSNTGKDDGSPVATGLPDTGDISIGGSQGSTTSSTLTAVRTSSQSDSQQRQDGSFESNGEQEATPTKERDTESPARSSLHLVSRKVSPIKLRIGRIKRGRSKTLSAELKAACKELKRGRRCQDQQISLLVAKGRHVLQNQTREQRASPNGCTSKDQSATDIEDSNREKPLSSIAHDEPCTSISTNLDESTAIQKTKWPTGYQPVSISDTELIELRKRAMELMSPEGSSALNSLRREFFNQLTTLKEELKKDERHMELSAGQSQPKQSLCITKTAEDELKDVNTKELDEEAVKEKEGKEISVPEPTDEVINLDDSCSSDLQIVESGDEQSPKVKGEAEDGDWLPAPKNVIISSSEEDDADTGEEISDDEDQLDGNAHKGSKRKGKSWKKKVQCSSDESGPYTGTRRRSPRKRCMPSHIETYVRRSASKQASEKISSILTKKSDTESSDPPTLPSPPRKNLSQIHIHASSSEDEIVDITGTDTRESSSNIITPSSKAQMHQEGTPKSSQPENQSIISWMSSGSSFPTLDAYHTNTLVQLKSAPEATLAFPTAIREQHQKAWNSKPNGTTCIPGSRYPAFHSYGTDTMVHPMSTMEGIPNGNISSMEQHTRTVHGTYSSNASSLPGPSGSNSANQQSDTLAHPMSTMEGMATGTTASIEQHTTKVHGTYSSNAPSLPGPSGSNSANQQSDTLAHPMSTMEGMATGTTASIEQHTTKVHGTYSSNAPSLPGQNGSISGAHQSNTLVRPRPTPQGRLIATTTSMEHTARGVHSKPNSTFPGWQGAGTYHPDTLYLKHATEGTTGMDHTAKGTYSKTNSTFPGWQGARTYHPDTLYLKHAKEDVTGMEHTAIGTYTKPNSTVPGWQGLGTHHSDTLYLKHATEDATGMELNAKGMYSTSNATVVGKQSSSHYHSDTLVQPKHATEGTTTMKKSTKAVYSKLNSTVGLSAGAQTSLPKAKSATSNEPSSSVMHQKIGASKNLPTQNQRFLSNQDHAASDMESVFIPERYVIERMRANARPVFAKDAPILTHSDTYPQHADTPYGTNSLGSCTASIATPNPIQSSTTTPNTAAQNQLQINPVQLSCVSKMLQGSNSAEQPLDLTSPPNLRHASKISTNQLGDLGEEPLDLTSPTNPRHASNTGQEVGDGQEPKALDLSNQKTPCQDSEGKGPTGAAATPKTSKNSGRKGADGKSIQNSTSSSVLLPHSQSYPIRQPHSALGMDFLAGLSTKRSTLLNTNYMHQCNTDNGTPATESTSAVHTKNVPSVSSVTCASHVPCGQNGGQNICGPSHAGASKTNALPQIGIPFERALSIDHLLGNQDRLHLEAQKWNSMEGGCLDSWFPKRKIFPSTLFSVAGGHGLGFLQEGHKRQTSSNTGSALEALRKVSKARAIWKNMAKTGKLYQYLTPSLRRRLARKRIPWQRAVVALTHSTHGEDADCSSDECCAVTDRVKKTKKLKKRRDRERKCLGRSPSLEMLQPSSWIQYEQEPHPKPHNPSTHYAEDMVPDSSPSFSTPCHSVLGNIATPEKSTDRNKRVSGRESSLSNVIPICEPRNEYLAKGTATSGIHGGSLEQANSSHSLVSSNVDDLMRATDNQKYMGAGHTHVYGNLLDNTRSSHALVSNNVDGLMRPSDNQQNLAAGHTHVYGNRLHNTRSSLTGRRGRNASCSGTRKISLGSAADIQSTRTSHCVTVDRKLLLNRQNSHEGGCLHTSGSNLGQKLVKSTDLTEYKQQESNMQEDVDCAIPSTSCAIMSNVKRADLINKHLQSNVEAEEADCIITNVRSEGLSDNPSTAGDVEMNEQKSLDNLGFSTANRGPAQATDSRINTSSYAEHGRGNSDQQKAIRSARKMSQKQPNRGNSPERSKNVFRNAKKFVENLLTCEVGSTTGGKEDSEKGSSSNIATRGLFFQGRGGAEGNTPAVISKNAQKFVENLLTCESESTGNRTNIATKCLSFQGSGGIGGEALADRSGVGTNGTEATENTGSSQDVTLRPPDIEEDGQLWSRIYTVKEEPPSGEPCSAWPVETTFKLETVEGSDGLTQFSKNLYGDADVGMPPATSSVEVTHSSCKKRMSRSMKEKTKQGSASRKKSLKMTTALDSDITTSVHDITKSYDVTKPSDGTKAADDVQEDHSCIIDDLPDFDGRRGGRKNCMQNGKEREVKTDKDGREANPAECTLLPRKASRKAKVGKDRRAAGKGKAH